MDELIKIKNSAYARYEEALLTRDNLQKEAFQYERAYVREFGDMILDIFRKKIECIRKKKTIEYCQAAVNHDRPVDQDQLQEYLRQEMEAFQEQLDAMVEDAEHAKNSKQVSEVDLLMIKRIYHKLVKLVHPDINPLTNETPELAELWQRIQMAYNCNDKKGMQELELLTTTALEQLGVGTLEIEIPDIEEKIAEIEGEIVTIRETDPYQYKYLLEDSKAVDEKKADLARELKSYEEYDNQLDKILEEFMEDGVRFIWRMN